MEILRLCIGLNRPVSSVIKAQLLVAEVWGSNLGSVKLDNVATAATFFRSCVAQALSRGSGPC